VASGSMLRSSSSSCWVCWRSSTLGTFAGAGVADASRGLSSSTVAVGIRDVVLSRVWRLIDGRVLDVVASGFVGDVAVAVVARRAQ
jgi:hypothetical protein